MSTEIAQNAAVPGAGGAAPSSTDAQKSNTKANKTAFWAPTTSSVMKKVEVAGEDKNAHPEPPKPRGLTVPHSPKFHSKTTSKQHVLTSEELEAQRIDEFRKAEAARNEAKKKSYEKLKSTANIAAKSSGASRSTKQLTIPETPMHNLVKRLGAKEQAANAANAAAMGGTGGSAASGGEVRKALNFDQSQAQAQNQGPRGPTMPQPFHFATTKRFGDAAPAATASAAANGPRSASPTGQQRSRYTGQPTIPTAPVFETDKRAAGSASSGSAPLSTEERERRMMEEFRKNPFKARPVEKHVLTASQAVHPPPPPPKLTEPKPFNLAIDQRIPVKPPAPPTTAGASSPERASSPPRGPRAPTIPVSPHFHGKSKTTAAYDAHRQASPTAAAAAAGAHASASASASAAGPAQPTKPQPFRLLTSDRGMLYKEMLQMKIKQEAEAEKAMHETKNAYVHPVPTVVKDITKVFIPSPSTRPPTAVKEFALTSNVKHEEAAAKMAAKLKAESDAAAAEREYRARPCPKNILEKPDFVPHRASEGVVQVIAAAMSDLPSTGAGAGAGAGAGDGSASSSGGNGATTTVVIPPRPKLMPSEVSLRTAGRASHRSEFDSTTAARLSAAEAAKAAKKEEKEAAAARELQALRRLSIEEGGFCFKAKAVGSTTHRPSSSSGSGGNHSLRGDFSSSSASTSSSSALNGPSPKAFPLAQPVTSKSFSYFTPMTEEEVAAQKQTGSQGHKQQQKGSVGKENSSNNPATATAGAPGTGLRSKPQRLGMSVSSSADSSASAAAAAATSTSAATEMDTAQ